MTSRFDGLFDDLCQRRGIGCAITDPQLKVIDVGGAHEVWGDLQVGMPLTDAVPELFGARDGIAETIATGEPFVLAWLNRPARDGGVRYYELSVHNRADAPEQWVHWLVDVTGAGRLKGVLNQQRNELVLAQDALDLRNRDLELFLRAAGHDLKSPLRTLEGFLELVAAEHTSPLVDASRDLASQLGDLVEALLAYARLGGKPVELGPVELGPIVQNVLDRLAVSIAERDATIDVVSPLPVVRGEATLLGQALYNLIDNGLKYGGQAPRVRIEARDVGGRWCVSVEDSGPGIKPASREKIFEPLVRLGRSIPGHGFGLATVQRCVELMLGRVRAVEPTGPGGARFEIELGRAES